MSKGVEKMETNEVNLLDFPDEILLVIFSHLTNTSLVHSTRVCQRFKSIAEDTFSTKYNGSSKEAYYVSNVFCESLAEEQKQYWSIFSTFGACMHAIKIIFYTGSRNKTVLRDVAKNHWLFGLVQRRCKSTTKVIIDTRGSVDIRNIIEFMPDLTYLSLNYLTLMNDKWTEYTYPRLVHFKARSVRFIEHKIKKFLDLNPQIESLKFLECENIQLTIINMVSGQLNKLKTLHLLRSEQLEYIGNSTIFKFDFDCEYLLRSSLPKIITKNTFGIYENREVLDLGIV